MEFTGHAIGEGRVREKEKEIIEMYLACYDVVIQKGKK